MTWKMDAGLPSNCAIQPVDLFRIKICEQHQALENLMALATKARRLSDFLQDLCRSDGFRQILHAEGIQSAPIIFPGGSGAPTRVNTPAPAAFADSAEFGGEHLSSEERNSLVVKALAAGLPEMDWELYRATLGASSGNATPTRRITPGLEALLDGTPGRIHWRTALKKMTPVRQDEVANLVGALSEYSKDFSLALLLATPPHELLNFGRKTANKRMQPALQQLESQLRYLSVEVYLVHQHVLAETVAWVSQRGFLRRLQRNERIFDWISSNLEFSAELVS